MKAPSKPTPPKAPSRKSTGKKDGGGINFSHVIDVVTTSAEATKAYFDYQSEIEVTNRALIDGERAIRLGEQQLEEARLLDHQHQRDHHAQMLGLDIQSQQAEHQHEQAMTALETKASREDRVLKQLESKSITAQEAAILLNGGQE